MNMQERGKNLVFDETGEIRDGWEIVSIEMEDNMLEVVYAKIDTDTHVLFVRDLDIDMMSEEEIDADYVFMMGQFSQALFDENRLTNRNRSFINEDVCLYFDVKEIVDE